MNEKRPTRWHRSVRSDASPGFTSYSRNIQKRDANWAESVCLFQKFLGCVSARN